MTQTMVSYALTSLDKVKSYIGIASGDTSKDVLLSMLIGQVSDFVQGYCGNRQFLAQTYTNEVYDSYPNKGSIGGSCIFLNQFPITALTTIEYRSGTITNPAWVVYDPNSYILYGKAGFVRFYAMLPQISQGLRFTYTAGYKIDFANEFDPTKHTLPVDLTGAVTELVALKYNLRQSQGIKSESTEGQSVTFDKMMTADQLAVLRRYQTLRVGI